MVVVASYKVGRREAQKVPDCHPSNTMGSKRKARKGECRPTRNYGKLRQRI
jgi:hypothetical protein